MIKMLFNFFNILSDSINRIIISQKKEFRYVLLPFSKFLISILRVLISEGYINNLYLFNFKFNYIIIKLKYLNKNPAITIFKNASKSGLKIYSKYKFIPRFMNGLGIIILSTSKGVMSDKKCKNLGIGGQIICYVF
ncbi:SSU ribosomal protein S8p (S15Ae) [Candidatus Nasuia deltocephalinicola]|uniref:Small ribosomal subunit protein uS8 n=1 Tax=Candidatus Nasuia deltocephalincola TaxID=1160784 RepID=A0A7G6UHK5_9PROT|nr:SSU ribosomal protein S8p (S15Ae) [Candidatus Nasuia deltocephalinicola]